MNSQPTRWGIVSAGKISFDFANSLTSNEVNKEHKVVAIAARSLDRAQEFADQFDIPVVYGSYLELSKDPNVEVAYVGSINPTHYEICKMMINAGKHVLCEKPLAMNYKQAEEIINLAKEKKVFLMDAMWSRFQPGHVQMKQELLNNTIGDVKSAIVTFGLEIKSDRISKMDLGGGTVLDLGVYCIYFLQQVFGGEKPLKIVANGSLNEEGTDESVGAVLSYSDGKMGIFTTHTKITYPCEAEIYGTKGSMKLMYPFHASKILSTPNKIYNFDFPEDCRYIFYFTNSSALIYEAKHVRYCLQNKMLESDVISHNETLLVTKIMEDIRKQVGVKYPQDDE